MQFVLDLLLCLLPIVLGLPTEDYVNPMDFFIFRLLLSVAGTLLFVIPVAAMYALVRYVLLPCLGDKMTAAANNTIIGCTAHRFNADTDYLNDPLPPPPLLPKPAPPPEETTPEQPALHPLNSLHETIPCDLRGYSSSEGSEDGFHHTAFIRRRQEMRAACDNQLYVDTKDNSNEVHISEGDDVQLQYSSDEDAIDYNKFIQRREDMRRACDQPVRVDINNSSDEVHIHVLLLCVCLPEHRLPGLYALTTLCLFRCM